MAERASKRFSYRQCRFNKKGIVLQERLQSALQALPKANSRIEQLSANETSARRFINYFSSGPALCGELIIFEPGRAREIVGQDDNAEFLPLSALHPPRRRDGTSQQFVDSILYFCIIENHLSICESRGLRSTGLERHIDWILSEQTDAISNDVLITLDQTFSKNIAQRINVAGVRSIKLLRPLFDDVESVPQKSNKDRMVLQPRGIGLDALKTFLGNAANSLDSMRLDNLLDPDSLDVSVEIRVRGRNNEKGIELAASLLNLAHIDPSSEGDGPQVELQLGDKTKVKHGEMMPYHVVNVPARDGIPNRSELWEEMRNWLSELIE